VDALKAVLFKNAGLMTVVWDVAYLAGFAAVLLTVSIVLFRRTL
jgi:hypothetical protein